MALKFDIIQITEYSYCTVVSKVMIVEAKHANYSIVYFKSMEFDFQLIITFRILKVRVDHWINVQQFHRYQYTVHGMHICCTSKNKNYRIIW